MIDTSQALFLFEVLGVLALPGPTNSLLFVSGVTRGFQASLNLVLAELGAYLLSLSALVFVLVPASQSHSVISHLLHLLCSTYLVYVAYWLWRSGERGVRASHPITFPRVFLTTLVNPKNLIFAFGVFPVPSAPFEGMIPYFASFSVICAGVACCWIAAGMVLHSTGAHKLHLNWFYRGEACLLVGFAVLILFSAYY